VVVVVHAVAATGECRLGVQRWTVAMDGRAEAEWGAWRPSGWPARDGVDSQKKAEWAWRRIGACAGDGGVSGWAQDGARGGGVRRLGARGTRGDGHGGQRSGTSRIFFE
jgi:hypothetical protein